MGPDLVIKRMDEVIKHIGAARAKVVQLHGEECAQEPGAQRSFPARLSAQVVVASSCFPCPDDAPPCGHCRCANQIGKQADEMEKIAQEMRTLLKNAPEDPQAFS